MKENTKKLYQQFLNNALQLWTTKGIDSDRADFVEQLSFSGELISEDFRRGRVQARQIFTVARMLELGYAQNDDELKNILHNAYKKMQDDYCFQGALIFKKPLSANSIEPQLFAYEQAFFIMASVAMFRITNNKIYADYAEDSWQWLENNLLDTNHGGFYTSINKSPSEARQQNPHMHLFEACMFAMQSFNQQQWQSRSAWLFSLFEKYFWDAQENCLREFFYEDWQPHSETGDNLEPGHHFEWCWLLWQYEKLTNINTSDFREKLFAYGANYGLNDNGFGKDEMYSKGRELRSTSRLWVQCELLKAYVAMNKPAEALQLLEQMFAKYLHAQTGTWYDQLDVQGNNISKDSPASSFYHIFIALHEVKDL